MHHVYAKLDYADKKSGLIYANKTITHRIMHLMYIHKVNNICLPSV